MIKNHATIAFPDTKIFQMTTYRVISKTDELLKLIGNMSSDHDMAIKNITDTVGLQADIYYMKKKAITGEDSDQFLLSFMPNYAFIYDFDVKLRPCCEEGNISKIKECLYSSIYDSFRISFDHKKHFDNEDKKISIGKDGSCSIRALYVIYCIIFDCNEYQFKDCDFNDPDHFKYFKQIMDDIGNSIIEHKDVHDKFMALYNDIRDQVGKLHLKSNTSKKSKAKTLNRPCFDVTLWLSNFTMIEILRLLKCKVAVFANQNTPGKKDWVMLEAVTFPYNKSHIGMNLQFIDEALKSEVKLVLTDSHFHITTQSFDHTVLVEQRMLILCETLSNEATSSISKNVETVKVDKETNCRSQLFALYTFIKNKKKSNALYDGPAELNGMGGIPTMSGMINILLELKTRFENLPLDKRYCFELGSATGFSSLIYFVVILNFKVWGNEINFSSYHNSLVLQSYLTSKKYEKDIKDYVKSYELTINSDKNLSASSSSGLNIIDISSLNNAGSKVCFNLTIPNAVTEDLLDKTSDWKNSISLVYAYCDGVTEEDLEWYFENIWNKIETLQYFITSSPLINEDKFYDLGFTGKLLLIYLSYDICYS